MIEVRAIFGLQAFCSQNLYNSLKKFKKTGIFEKIMEISGKNQLLKASMHYGAIAGGLLSIPILLFYITGNINSTNLTSIQHMLCIPAVTFYIRWYRDKFTDGDMAYGMALKLGFLLMMFASVIIAFVTFLFYTLDGEMFILYKKLMTEAFSELTTSDEFKTLWLDSIDVFTPTTMALGKVFEFSIFGLIFSLIIAIFIRKRRVFPNNDRRS